ncbi:hypothetical protein HY640_00410 [Candidatus Woesearchaeota archaeon]|nr:hypothetical protein [Candidatus Woesearchaeota archaeon]
MNEMPDGSSSIYNADSQSRHAAAAYNVIAALITALAALALITNTAAAPQGINNITIVSTETYNDNLSPKTVPASAGNVSMVTLTDTKVTSRWQGYYGNLTGTVTLSDASNNTLYSWELQPSGEVYASNHSTVDWSSIKCVNFTSNLSDGWTFNITTLERFYNAGRNDVDGIDETFNTTYTNATGFTAGSVLINDQQKCPLTYTFVNNAYQTTEFEEILLTDNSSVVFTTLLENGLLGFDGRKWDFQMLVAENGDDPAPTNYYFFVEVT